VASGIVNAVDARRTLAACLARYRRMTYAELASLIGTLETGEAEGERGTKFQYEVSVHWDDPYQPHDVIRIFGSIDDGHSRAPLFETFLVAPDGSLIEE
jgi:hypothetical protein